MNKFFMTDSSGKKSATLTAFAIGFLVVNVKLLLGGLSIAGFTMSAFSGSEYGIAVGALGSIYVLRRATNSNNEEKSKK